MIQVYHNARCTKSRECLAFIESSGKEYKIVRYLEDVPTFDELKTIIKKLNIKPLELVRKKEKIWLEQFEGKSMSDDDIINAMVSNPILIERPIVVNGDHAIIARPIENAAKIL